MKVTRERKLTVFRKFTATTCPACGFEKNRMHWLCPCCQPVVPWHVRALVGVACAAHVLAAERRIAVAAKKRRA